MNIKNLIKKRNKLQKELTSIRLQLRKNKWKQKLFLLTPELEQKLKKEAKKRNKTQAELIRDLIKSL